MFKKFLFSDFPSASCPVLSRLIWKRVCPSLLHPSIHLSKVRCQNVGVQQTWGMAQKSKRRCAVVSSLPSSVGCHSFRSWRQFPGSFPIIAAPLLWRLWLLVRRNLELKPLIIESKCKRERVELADRGWNHHYSELLWNWRLGPL